MRRVCVSMLRWDRLHGFGYTVHYALPNVLYRTAPHSCMVYAVRAHNTTEYVVP